MTVAGNEPQDPLKVWECKALQKKGSIEGLNINGGGGQTSQIKIRLRPHGRDNVFLPYECLLGTMLHELVHNVRGPHDAVFYKLLDEITEECEGFMAKGIAGSGAGFDAASVGKLGGRGPVPVHNPPAHQMKSQALKAAEARAKQHSLMSAGPRKLGGDLSMLKNLTPAQAAARAAERRATDNVWCPCGDHGTALDYNDGQVIALAPHTQNASQPSSDLVVSNLPALRGQLGTQSHQQPHRNVQDVRQEAENKPPAARPSASAQCSAQDFVDLTLDDSNAAAVQSDAGVQASKRARRQTSSAAQHQDPQSSHHSAAGRVPHCTQQQQQWTCTICTLLNDDLTLQCGACGQARPAGFHMSFVAAAVTRQSAAQIS